MDNLFVGSVAREGIARGVKKVNEAIKLTYGAAGANGIIEAFEGTGNIITNDGISLIEAMHFEDPLEARGLALIKEVSSRSDKESGDGTTAACILTNAIIEEGLKVIDQIHPMALKKELEDCIPLINASIKEQTREITVDEVGKVAAISAEDDAMGALIQEIYQKIGKDGILYPDISKTNEDHYVLGKGITVHGAGFISRYMVDVNEGGQGTTTMTATNPKILITKQKITSGQNISKLCEKLNQQQIKELVIFADEVDGIILPGLLQTRQASGFRVTIVKMPVLWKDWWFEDLAKITGATVIDPTAGVSFKEMGLHHLGTCGSIIVDKSDTYLDGILDVSEHITALEGQDDEGKIRAARLNTKTARLFIGAHTETALSYKRLKLTDARNAAWQALHGGVCAGGGVALENVSRALPETVGGKILKTALLTPIKQIIENAGSKMVAHGNPSLGWGYDVKQNTIVSMFEAGIVDPANVIKNSVKNAISVAASVLTASMVITLKK